MVLGGLGAGALAGAISASLEPASPTGAGPFAGWRAVLSDQTFGRAVGFTIAVTVTATAVATVLAVLLAAVLRRRSPSTRSFTAVPVAVPHLVIAALAVAWIGPGGIVERAFGSVPVTLVGDSLGLGIIAVYVVKETPFLALLVLAALGRDTDRLEEAAAAHGAGRMSRLRHVVVPAAAPALAGGAMIVAAFTLGATEVPYVIGPTRPGTIATYALDATRIDGPLATTHQAAALLVVTALAIVLAGVGAALWRVAHRGART